MNPPNWKRTYWAVWVANLVTAIGMMSFLPFFPSYLEELGLTDRDEIAAWTGVIYGAAPLVAAYMSPVWGSIGDRIGRKWMVLRALCAIALFVGGMSFVTAPWQLLALRIGQGVFSGFVAPSVTLVSIAAPAAAQGRVAGSLQTSLAAGSIIGPLMGAAIAEHWSVSAIFLVVSAAAVVGGLLVSVFAYEDPSLRMTKDVGSKRGMFSALADDVARLRANAALRRAVLLLFFVQFGVGATNPQLELYVRDLTGGGPEEVRRLTALLFTLLAATALVATPIWGRIADRRSPQRALVEASVLSCVALAFHAIAPIYSLLVVARVLLGATSSGTGPSAFGVAAEESPVERRGGAFGAVFSARALAISLGSMSGGWLTAVLGIRGTFVLGAGLVLVALLSWGRGAVVRPRSSESGART